MYVSFGHCRTCECVHFTDCHTRDSIISLHQGTNESNLPNVIVSFSSCSGSFSTDVPFFISASSTSLYSYCTTLFRFIPTAPHYHIISLLFLTNVSPTYPDTVDVSPVHPRSVGTGRPQTERSEHSANRCCGGEERQGGGQRW